MRKLLRGTSLLVCLAATVSCFDEDYDLNKINTDDMVVKMETISAPIGSLEPIKIGDLLSVENNEYVRISETGDYSVHFEGATGETVFNVPTFKMKTNECDVKSKVITYSPMLVSGTSPTVPVEFKHGLEINETSIPKEIVSVQSVKVDATLNFAFTFRSNYGHLKAIILAAGTTLEFPSWLTLGDYDKNVVSKSGNVLTLLKDQRLSDTGLAFSCKATDIDFTKLPDGQGLIGEGNVYVNDSLIVKGGVYMKEEDIIDKVTLDKFTATFSCAISEVEAISAIAVIDPDINMDFKPVETTALASLFGAGSNLDIYDMNINLSVKNGTVLNAVANANLDAYKNGSILHTAHLGPLDIDASKTTDITLGMRSGQPAEGLNEVIACLPDSLGISGFSVKALSEPVEYIAGSRYTISADYSVDAPIAFGKNLNISLESTIDVGIRMHDYQVESLVLSFNAENTIPLGMSATVEVLGTDTESIEPHVVGDTKVSVEGTLEPGSLRQPSSNDMKITVNVGKDTKTIDSLRLVFRARCDEAHEGISLNREQSLTLKDISLTLNNIKIPIN